MQCRIPTFTTRKMPTPILNMITTELRSEYGAICSTCPLGSRTRAERLGERPGHFPLGGKAALLVVMQLWHAHRPEKWIQSCSSPVAASLGGADCWDDDGAPSKLLQLCWASQTCASDSGCGSAAKGAGGACAFAEAALGRGSA